MNLQVPQILCCVQKSLAEKAQSALWINYLRYLDLLALTVRVYLIPGWICVLTLIVFPFAYCFCRFYRCYCIAACVLGRAMEHVKYSWSYKYAAFYIPSDM